MMWGMGSGRQEWPNVSLTHRTYDYDPEAYREVVKSADLPWRWTELTRREDWPPRSREPAPDMSEVERQQLAHFWQDVDRATDIIELANTPAHERDHYQIPDDYSTDRELFDRLEARRAAEESLGRYRARRMIYDREDAHRMIVGDRTMGALRQWQELERRLHDRMYPNGGRPEPTDWTEVRRSMDAFHEKLLEMRMMEEENRRNRDRFAEWARQQREPEQDRPAPGPDGDLAPRRELDRAQERMVEDMERPVDDREPLSWIEAARAEVERQYGPDPSRERPSHDGQDRDRGERERPDPGPDWLRDADGRRS